MKRSRSVDGDERRKRPRLDDDGQHGDDGERDARSRWRRGGSEPPTGERRPTLQLTGFNPTEYFELEEKQRKRWRGGPIISLIYGIKLIKKLPDVSGIERQVMISKILEAAFRQILDKAPATSKCQLIIENENFNKQIVATCRQKPSQLTFNHIANRLDSLLNSDETVNILDSDINLMIFDKAVIGYQKRTLENRDICDQSEYLDKMKKSVYNPSNVRTSKWAPNLCIPLILARELHAMDPARTTRIQDYLYTKASVIKAKELVRMAGLQPEMGPFTFEQLPEFAKVLPPDVSLRFFSGCAPPVIHLNPGQANSINIALAYNQDDDGISTFHGHCITSLKAFFSCAKLCEVCFKIDYSRKYAEHKCMNAICKLCKYNQCLNRTTENNPANLQLCDSCEQFFPTLQCLQAHTTCQAMTRCQKCRVPIRYKSSHVCLKPACAVCKRNHTPLELCFVKPDTPYKVSNRKSVWYADAETQQDDRGEHSAILIILRKSTGREYFEYKGIHAMRDFVRDCMRNKSKYRKSFIVWHNASRFDAHLWWKELIRVRSPPKNIRRRGQQILSMEMAQNGIVCRDSLLYLSQTPLSAFPKMFGLETGSKGDFPHGLSTPEWVSYDGKAKKVYKEVINGKEHRFPLIKYFWPEKKHAEEAKKLRAWHAEQVARFEADPSLSYYPEQELIKYCRQDVKILHQGFERYRQTWAKQYPAMEIFNSTTLPSFNNAILRNFCLPEDSLGIIPPEGFDGASRRYSAKSLAWLAYIEKTENLKGLRHARKYGEARLTRHYVDGIAWSGETLHVFNFNGCRDHAHDERICPKRTARSEPELARARRLRTSLTDRDLKQLETSKLYGETKYRVIWECDFDQQCKDDPDMKAFVDDYIQKYKAAGDPIRPREAMRGGRTNVIKHKIEQVPIGYMLAYLDFTSLYPAVNASVNGERWPIGHPDIYIGKDMENAPSDWFGIAKVAISPPRGLKHGVLGQMFNGGRVLYHCCTKCAESLNGGECRHSEQQRMIHGTFFTGELDLAVEMGYQIKQVHELWDWRNTTSDLFRSFITKQYKNKVIASKKPADTTDLLEDLASLGIEVGVDEWCENPPMRAASKSSINCVWGFLGAHQNHENTEVVTTLARLQEIEADEKNPVTRVEMADDEEQLFVVTKPLRELPGTKHNIILAIMTTAYARIALYKVIREYSDEVVYFDTDSVFLLLPPNKKPPKTSNRLGGLKDEILEKFGEGARIKSFTSISPKSYCYEVEKDGEVVAEEVRLKGIRMNEEAAQTMTPSNIAALVPNDVEDSPLSLAVPQHMIQKNLFKTSLRNIELVKHVKFNCTKRWIKPDPNPQLDTLPYGY